MPQKSHLKCAASIQVIVVDPRSSRRIELGRSTDSYHCAGHQKIVQLFLVPQAARMDTHTNIRQSASLNLRPGFLSTWRSKHDQEHTLPYSVFVTLAGIPRARRQAPTCSARLREVCSSLSCLASLSSACDSRHSSSAFRSLAAPAHVAHVKGIKKKTVKRHLCLLPHACLHLSFSRIYEHVLLG